MARVSTSLQVVCVKSNAELRKEKASSSTVSTRNFGVFLRSKASSVRN